MHAGYWIHTGRFVVTRHLWHLGVNISSKFPIGFTNNFIAFSVTSVTTDITYLDNFVDNLKNVKEFKFNSNNLTNQMQQFHKFIT